MTSSLRVSLIATVKDELPSLQRWLDGIDHQHRQPDEIIIVDGGSTDGTWECLQEWAAARAVRLHQVPGASISVGRNIAFDLANEDVFAVTDCGTVAEPHWLERLLEPFEDPCVDVVSGFFVPMQPTRWSRVLAAATLPDVEEISPQRFLPSSRSVAVRASWVRNGFLYPEWLDYCEDLIWDMQLRNAGARFHFAPDARVAFEVRADVRSFWNQYYQYARGDGKAGLFGKRHVIRYLTYLLGTTVLARHKPMELLLAAAFGCVYLRKPVTRLLRRDRSAGMKVGESARLLPVLPALVAVGDAAKMAGYPAGLMWRLRTFGSIKPARSWRRVTPAGDLWDPAEPLATSRRLAD